MSRKVLKAAKCSQMSSPKTGSGSGGDRCTEAVGAMIDATYELGPWAKDGKHTVEQIMYQLTEMLNHGSDTSVPENMGDWFTRWLHTNGYDKEISLHNTTNPTFDTIVACIDRGHIAIGGFNDYVNLRLADGSNPYKWSDPHGLGHVLLIVGYDTDKHTVVVHDPLRADPNGQPADYSWGGFQAAKFHDCTEVIGTALPFTTDTAGGAAAPGVPAGWHDDGKTLTAPNGVPVVMGFREWVLAHQWDADNWPLAPERVVDSVEWGNASIGKGSRQDFRLCSLGWTTSRNVYVIWVGQDIEALAAQVADLQKKLAAAPVLDVGKIKTGLSAADQALSSLQTEIKSIETLLP